MSDATDTWGLDFQHVAEAEQSFFMPRSIGSGAVLLDANNDGLLDVYLIQNGGPQSTARNQLLLQTAARQFVREPEGFGADVAGWGMGGAAGDVNNDGRTDLFLTEYGRVRLFLNESTGSQVTFRDVSESSGIANPLWGTSTCFVDYDRDDWLDILVVNYVNYDPSRTCADGGGDREFCGPNAFQGRVARLFRNLGTDSADGCPLFEDVTISAGLSEYPGPGLGVFCADFDGDRWPDIFVANDGQPNHLWMNQQDGSFREEATLRGIGYNSMGKSEADMGIAIGDVNGDGRFDIFVTHLTIETHTLWQQQAPGVFQDFTATSGVMSTAWRGTGFGTAMADFDNDGWIDLAIANGRVTRVAEQTARVDDQLDPFWHPYAERDQLLLNNGAGTFVDESEANDDFCGTARVSRGLACGDFNNDGGIDVLVTHIAGPAKLYQNTAADRGHWLLVRAIDPQLKRDMYGAEVYLQAGERTWMRWINPGYSFLCSNDPRAHFGLGEAVEFDRLRVVWPDGSEEVFPGGPADRMLVVERGTGQSSP